MVCNRDYRFSRIFRLTTKTQFNWVFAQVDYKNNSDCFLFLARFTENSFMRLGMIVAKKNIRLANKRNKIKRLIREQFRFCKQEIGLDLIVVVKKPAHNLDDKSLFLMLNQQFKQVICQCA